MDHLASIIWRVTKIDIKYFLLIVSIIIQWNPIKGLVQTTKYHQLYHCTPTRHAQLHFLNGERLNNTDLIFWNGLGSLDERVYILTTAAAMETHKHAFDQHELILELEYKQVKITYVEYNIEKPNTFPTQTRLEEEAQESDEDDDTEKALNALDPDENLEEKLLKGHQFNDQEMAERLIYKRKNKYYSVDGNTLEATPTVEGSPGLLPILPIFSYDNRHLSINSGLLYRIQGIQTLILGNTTTNSEDGEWQITKEGEKIGMRPRIGEYLFASFENERDGSNPIITAEESKYWKNTEYRVNRTKGALWMFIPSERPKFYEIRNRNYPASLLIWSYDKEEGEFVVYLETRRSYLKRYYKDGSLRNRALFSFERVSETYKWELTENRPKYWIYTYNQNHLYLYESTIRGCSILIVRNSAERPYIPDKTDKYGRPLDMFYITRIDLTGDYTASIFSFLFDKSIVDIFAESQKNKNGVEVLKEFQITNRGPNNLTHFIFDEIEQSNQVQFRFNDKFTGFQWVTLEAQLPSFGIAPVIMTGIFGKNTDAGEIEKSFRREYEIQDRLVVGAGSWVDCQVIFQRIEDFENGFSAIMEVMEPVDRLYWDKQGNPRYVRMSLPGKMIEESWKNKAGFRYERILEIRETALVVQIRGFMKGSYGLRAFVKKVERDYGPAEIVSCAGKDD